MSECEVSLRAAFFLVREGLAAADVSVAIDGAQVRTGNTVHFPISEFMAASGWTKAVGDHEWRGRYSHPEAPVGIDIHSTSGRGDLVVPLKDGRTLRAESKKGPHQRSKSSAEYPLMREALGQLLTVEEASPDDLLAIIVPSSERFDELARRWRGAPLVTRIGVQIWTVSRDGGVRGFEARAN